MKKVLLATAVMLLGWSLSLKAEMWKTPHSDSMQGLATADYGGVQYSTAAFWTGFATCTIVGRGVFYGVIFTTGSTSDFVDVYDATSTYVAGFSGPFTRLYNVNTSSGGPGAFAAGFSGPVKPVRFVRGLFFKPSTAIYNLITGLYYCEQDANKK